MKEIYFVTGNEGKFREAAAVFPHVKRISIELPEIQSLDPKVIIEAKLKSAQAMGYSNVLVDDTSLVIRSLKGLPGPLVKLFLESLGKEGLYELAVRSGNTAAAAMTVAGFCDHDGRCYFGSGECEGEIVPPRGAGFGWDSIFCPNGSTKTFGEMTTEEKAGFSMRKKALLSLESSYGLLG